MGGAFLPSSEMSVGEFTLRVEKKSKSYFCVYI